MYCSINIQSCAEAVSESFDHVDGNIVQAVQFVDDGHLDQLIEAEGPAWSEVIFRVIDLVNRVAAKQNVQGCRFAHPVRVRDRPATHASERTLKACTRDAIEADVEDEQLVVQQHVMQRGKMPLGIGRTDAEIAFGLDAQHASGQQLTRAEKHIFLKTFNVDLEEVSSRDDALVEKCVEAADRYVASLLFWHYIESTFAAQIHRARRRIGRVEVKNSLFIRGTRRHPVVMSIFIARASLFESSHSFFDRVEAMEN
jgi:hypothetical protein